MGGTTTPAVGPKRALFKFDVADRYRGLADFYSKHALPVEAAEAERLLAVVLAGVDACGGGDGGDGGGGGDGWRRR